MQQEPKELGIYIHIPFCKQKCLYCDFVSFPNMEEFQEEYIEQLLKEIEKQKEILQNYKITTIYIGGGTPSLIKSKWIKHILSKIENIANIKIQESEIEVTIEINPGAVDKQKLQDYKEAGINRISIGLQSTNDTLLKELGRIHTYEVFKQTYENVINSGFKNINVDLMIGLPNQTINHIKTSIEEITNLKLKPNHISVYSLIVEENTPIEKLINEKKLELPTDEEERKQYQYVKNMLELQGYKHYEISNFAIPGKESKHNTNCWEQKEYIGFGLAAHSYIDKKRFSNTDNISEYLNGNNKKIIHEEQTQEDQEKEYMLLALRKLEGVEITKFKAKFGKNPLFVFRKEIEKLVNEELIEVDLDNIRLTRKGLDLANLVWEEFV